MRSPRRLLPRLLALVAVLLLVAACGEDGDAPDGAADEPAGEEAEAEADDEEAAAEEDPEPASFALALHWTVPVSDWIGIIAAAELGYYDDEALDIEFRYLQGSGPVMQTVGAGDSELGVTGPDSYLIGAAEGLPVTAVANHLQITPTGVLVPGEAGVTEPTALEGMTIATAHASPEPAMLRAMATSVGLDPDADMELTFVDPQAKCTVVLAGQADACTGFNNFQAIQMEQEGADPTFISFSTPDAPMLGHVIVGNDEFLEGNAEVVTRFLRATMRGYAWADENPEETVDLYTDVNPETDEEFLAAAIDQTRQLLRSDRTDEHGWGWMDDESWQTLHDALLEGEVIAQPVEIGDAYTNDFLPEERTEWEQ